MPSTHPRKALQPTGQASQGCAFAVPRQVWCAPQDSVTPLCDMVAAMAISPTAGASTPLGFGAGVAAHSFPTAVASTTPTCASMQWGRTSGVSVAATAPTAAPRQESVEFGKLAGHTNAFATLAKSPRPLSPLQPNNLAQAFCAARSCAGPRSDNPWVTHQNLDASGTRLNGNSPGRTSVFSRLGSVTGKCLNNAFVLRVMPAIVCYSPTNLKQTSHAVSTLPNARTVSGTESPRV